MAVRPDGGWGWIVAIASFAINMVADGVKYSFGIMFVELLETFQHSKSDTSWIMSIQIGIMFLSGPILAALVNRFGCKAVAIAGTLLSSAGFLASAFAESLYIMFVTFGLLGGFGFGMLMMPMVVMLARHFDKRLAFASGIAAMGSGFGTLVFNPLSKILIDKYTWRGTLIINAGIILNGVVCALVMRPPDETSTTLRTSVKENKEFNRDIKQRFKTDDKYLTTSDCLANASELQSLKDGLEAETEEEDENVQADSDKTNIENTNYVAFLCEKQSMYQVKNSNTQRGKEKAEETESTMISPVIKRLADTQMNKEQDKDICGSGSLKYIGKFTEEKEQKSELSEDILNNFETVQTRVCQSVAAEDMGVNTNDEIVINSAISYTKETNSTAVTPSVKRSKKENLEVKPRRWFSPAPLKNPGFLLFLLAETLVQLSLNTPFTFLPDMMLHKGFQTQDAVWMLFIIGLVSTISRIVIGFIADLRFVNRLKLCNSIVLLNGLIVVLCPFCFNYATFVAFSVFFGFSAGSSSSLRYVLIPDLFGVEMIADFHGITMFFGGVAALVGLPKSGALFDATGNYVIPLVVAGAELTLSGVLLFLIPSVKKCSSVRESTA